MEKTLDDHLMGNFNENDFEFFKSFHRQEDAFPYVELLREHDLPYRLESTDVLITEAIVGTPIFPKIVLKILAEDFKKVNLIIESEILKNAQNLGEHYLNEFTDHELLELLKKPDESSIEEIIISKELLKSRGIPIEPAALEKMKKARLTELKKGRDGKLVWMFIYLFFLILGSIFFSPLAMIAGIGMGWYYWKDKSVDIDGNRYHTFNQKTRIFGIVMLWIAALIVVTAILLAIFWGFNIINPNQFFIGDFVR